MFLLDEKWIIQLSTPRFHSSDRNSKPTLRCVCRTVSLGVCRGRVAAVRCVCRTVA